MSRDSDLGVTAWSRVCREPNCWWCGPPRQTEQQASDDLANHMDVHYEQEKA